jgi:hypothetical protein
LADLTLAQFIDLFSRVSAYSLLLLALYALLRGWLVTSIRHSEMMREKDERIQELRDERDEWKEIALRGTDLADSSSTLAGKALDVARRRRTGRTGRDDGGT